MNSVRVLAAIAACLALLVSASVVEARGPQLGLVDDPAFNHFRAKQRVLALERAKRAGASTVRFTVDWSLVAPTGATKPAGFRAANPSEKEYKWGYVEDFVRDARRRRLRVVLTIARAPRWAEGRNRPSGAARGSWRPDPAELRAFATAIARRFSGFYPDPKGRGGDGLDGGGRALPAVRRWQVWDAPNSVRSLRPASPDVYRRLLAAAYRGVRGVSDQNVVVAGGTVPGSGDTRAPRFWRRLLCTGCAGPRARFGVAAHNPVAGNARPRASALRGALREIRSIVTRRAGRRPLWTQIGWTTPPVDRRGVSRQTQATYLVRAFHAISGSAEAIFWSGLRDTERGRPPSFPPVASGLWRSPNYRDVRQDVPKPALASYRFPFGVFDGRAWGLAPRSGRVAVQRRRAGRWRTVARVPTGGDRSFSRRVRGRGAYRAVIGRRASPVWRSGRVR